MKINLKLILGFVGIALLIGVVGYISMTTMQRALQKNIGENYVSKAVETLDEVDRTIFYRIERWKSYAYTNPRLYKTVAKSNQEYENLSSRQEYINQIDRDWKEGKDTPFIQNLLNSELSRRLRKRIEFYRDKVAMMFFLRYM